MKAIIFCGYHKSGKTTLLRRAGRGLVKRGYMVSTVKHSAGIRHQEAPALTDSDKLFQAGSESTVFISDGEAVLTKRIYLPVHGAESLLHTVLNHLDADYVLIEGFKSYQGPIPKVLFAYGPDDLTELHTRNTVAYSGAASHESWSETIHFLSPSAGEDELADFIEHHAHDSIK